MKIDTNAASASGPAPGALPDASRVFSLLDQLKGRSVDPGTAELVAKLTAELRQPKVELSRSAAIELRFGDEFHEGFANVLQDLSLQLKREGGARLEINETRGGSGSTMYLELSGGRDAVESAVKEIEQAARGAVDLRWAK
jgi:hypothetical protein